MAARKLTFTVGGLTCADCALRLEQTLQHDNSIKDVLVSVMAGSATVFLEDTADIEATTARLLKSAAGIGFPMAARSGKAEAKLVVDVAAGEWRRTEAIFSAIAGVSNVESVGRHGADVAVAVTYDPQVVGARDLLVRIDCIELRVCTHSGYDAVVKNHRRFLVGAVALTLTAVVLQYALPQGLGRYDMPLSGELTPRVLVQWLIATAAEWFFGRGLFVSAWRAARYSRTLTMDTLVTLSSGVAYLYGVALLLTAWSGQSVAGLGEPPFETVAILLGLVAVGRGIEAAAKRQTSLAVQSLAQLQRIDAILLSPAVAKTVRHAKALLLPCCAPKPSMAGLNVAVCQRGVLGKCRSCKVGCCHFGKRVRSCSAPCLASGCCDTVTVRGCTMSNITAFIHYTLVPALLNTDCGEREASNFCGSPEVRAANAPGDTCCTAFSPSCPAITEAGPLLPADLPTIPGTSCDGGPSVPVPAAQKTSCCQKRSSAAADAIQGKCYGKPNGACVGHATDAVIADACAGKPCCKLDISSAVATNTRTSEVCCQASPAPAVIGNPCFPMHPSVNKVCCKTDTNIADPSDCCGAQTSCKRNSILAAATTDVLAPPAEADKVSAGTDAVAVIVDASRVRLPPELLHLDDVVEVGPSQHFPADGLVVFGSSVANEAIVTGEQQPVLKDVAAEVIGGTVNGDGLLHVRVTSLPSMGTVSRIISLVEAAQAQRPRLQGIADSISVWFTPFVIVAGIVTLVSWVLASSYTDLATDGLSPGAFAMQFALSLIVVSCPCAIGLAVPTVIMVATSVATRYGLLLKSGQSLEKMAAVRHVIFDKTGTLTTGEPKVHKVSWYIIVSREENNSRMTLSWLRLIPLLMACRCTRWLPQTFKPCYSSWIPGSRTHRHLTIRMQRRWGKLLWWRLQLLLPKAPHIHSPMPSYSTRQRRGSCLRLCILRFCCAPR